MPRGIYNRTEEHKRKISTAHLGLVAGMFGKHHSADTKKKISEKNKLNPVRYWLGKKHPISKRVKQNTCDDCKKDLKNRYADRCKPCDGIVRRGENHYNWKGGISKDVHSTREPKYKKWRSDVFTRDNWTCQTCGVRGNYLEAHHIKGWAKYPELRYSLDNGVALCRTCHALTDNYRGKKQ